MSYTGRLGGWIALIIVAVADCSIFFSIIYFIPSSSPYHTPLQYIFDSLFFATLVVAYHAIRTNSRPARVFAYKPNPRLIYSTMVDDTDTDVYKRRLKIAFDLYLQGTINTDEEFFWHVGEHTPREERIFAALKNERENFRKFVRG